MQSWSAPLPPEQWAKPSAELQRLSEAVKTLRQQKPELNIFTRFTEVQRPDRKTA
jgi:hypothetical protein